MNIRNPAANKKVVLGLLFIFFIGFFQSCKKGNNSNPDRDEQENKVDAASSLQSYPGLNRVKLIWQVDDPSVKKAVVSTSGIAPKTVAYDGSGEMETIIANLKGGNHSIAIVLYDAEGNASSKAKIVVSVYGDDFKKSLESRAVKNAIYEKGTVKIAWESPSNKMTTTDIKYVTVLGDTLHQYLEAEEDSSLLKNYKPGTYFEYRTINKPSPEAIDSFYAAYVSSKTWSTFSNPLFRNKGADPWVAYKDGMYYFTYTQGGGITLYATKKMSQLGAAKPVEVWRPPSGTMYSRNLWAPELHYINGKWYVYFAADNGSDVNHRMYVIENSSADPLQKSWVFKGELEEPSDNWAIDGTPLEYKGQLYFIWSGKTNGTFPQNIYITKMSDPYTLAGSRVMISTPQYSWEKHGAAINEGPETLKNKKGEVFLTYSGSGFWTDDYCLGMLRLKKDGDPLNPSDWTKYDEPVFERNDAAGAYAPGHNGFFMSRDSTENWIIYHARSFPNGGSTNHRNPRIQPFTWKQDGSPDFGKPVKINMQMETPSGEF